MRIETKLLHFASEGHTELRNLTEDVAEALRNQACWEARLVMPMAAGSNSGENRSMATMAGVWPPLKADSAMPHECIQGRLDRRLRAGELFEREPRPPHGGFGHAHQSARAGERKERGSWARALGLLPWAVDHAEALVAAKSIAAPSLPFEYEAVFPLVGSEGP